MQNVTCKFNFGSLEKTESATIDFLQKRNKELVEALEAEQQSRKTLEERIEKIQKQREEESHNLWEFFEMLARMGTVSFEMPGIEPKTCQETGKKPERKVVNFNPR